MSTTVPVPSSKVGLPHPLSRKRVCPSPGTTHLRVRGWGGPNSDEEKKPTELCLLCTVIRFMSDAGK